MSQSILSSANSLEQAIRDSAEFAKLKALYEEVLQDEAAKEMFQNFREIQLRLQEKQMTGQPIGEEEVQQAQQAVAEIQTNNKIVSLMEAEQQMSLVIQEINKIVMKPLDDLYNGN